MNHNNHKYRMAVNQLLRDVISGEITVRECERGLDRLDEKYLIHYSPQTKNINTDHSRSMDSGGHRSSRDDFFAKACDKTGDTHIQSGGRE